jgi:RNA polymerase sigma-70 factor (ECF subfamily)
MELLDSAGVRSKTLNRLNRSQHMTPDANELVEKARWGDRAAAAKLIELHYERIYAFLRRLAANDADAADLTQRTFSRAWEALPGFAGRSSVSSWLHRIAYNAYVDWRRNDRHTEPRPDEWWAACPNPESTPDEIAAHTDLAAAVYGSVDQLEPDLRQTVHLHYYQDLTLRETADALGVATSTVKYRLRQALAELQRKLTATRTAPPLPTVSRLI